MTQEFLLTLFRDVIDDVISEQVTPISTNGLK